MTNNKQILGLIYNMGQSVLCSTRFQPNILFQSFEHCFTKNHGENSAPNISILSGVSLWDIKFTGYVANYFDTCKLTFARQKSITWIKQKNSNFDLDKTVRALKVITWSFSGHHTEKWMNGDYTLFFKLNWKVFKFVDMKICS